jgi:hypothetical protein
MDACFSRALAVSGEGNPRVGVLGGPQACSWKPRAHCTVKKAGFPWAVVWWAVAAAGKCRGASWWLSVCHAITNGKQGQGGGGFCVPAPLPPYPRPEATPPPCTCLFPIQCMLFGSWEERGGGQGDLRVPESQRKTRGVNGKSGEKKWRRLPTRSPKRTTPKPPPPHPLLPVKVRVHGRMDCVRLVECGRGLAVGLGVVGGGGGKWAPLEGALAGD